MLLEERKSLSLLHLNRLLCLLRRLVPSKQHTLNPEIQTPGIPQSALHLCKQMALCSWLYDVSLFKSKNNWGMERGMDVEDHGPLTPPETRSVLKLFDTTMLRVSTACSWVEMERTSVLSSCSSWSPALTFLQIFRPESPIMEKWKWWMSPSALIIWEFFFGR